MTTVLELHTEAMLLSDQAEEARNGGDFKRANDLAERALSLEIEAAQQIENAPENEPTRSMLYQNASAIAILANKPEFALRLAAEGLLGSPPLRVANELAALIERATQDRHLAINGLPLLDAEIQLVIAGGEVREGMLLLREFRPRLDAAIRMIARTLQRVAGQVFEPGSESSFLGHEPFISVPRAGSFAVTIGLTRNIVTTDGAFSQTQFGYDPASALTTFVEDMALLQAGRESEVRERVRDELYFESLVANASVLAPDGERITMVGLSDKSISTSISRSQASFRALHESITRVPTVIAYQTTISRGPYEVIGVLSAAKSGKRFNTFRITPDEGSPVTVTASDSIWKL